MLPELDASAQVLLLGHFAHALHHTVSSFRDHVVHQQIVGKRFQKSGDRMLMRWLPRVLRRAVTERERRLTLPCPLVIRLMDNSFSQSQLVARLAEWIIVEHPKR